MKIAIAGKGGVGKTTIMALIARQLQASGQDVLVIDADPCPHMAQTLGFANIESITPIADMGQLLAERAGKSAGSPYYNINPEINDLLADFMLESDGIKLMVLGAIQTAEGGCACPEATVLKRLLTKLLLGDDQAILLDMEAGVEHLGRGTIASVDELFIVAIPSKSSMRTATKIHKMAVDTGIKDISFIGNLVEDDDDRQFMNDNLPSRPVAFFPVSTPIRQAERRSHKLELAMDPQAAQAAEQVIAYLQARKD
ncbi:MAG: P-loop NTPase [Desulfobulbaceae bacterium]|jgi:CO dehydrogenase maturation factor|nr:P-loop NTPase [Desulfobulbaceae bacterium]